MSYRTTRSRLADCALNPYDGIVNEERNPMTAIDHTDPVPFNAITSLWTHNELLKSGKTLKTGDTVSTGTCLGVIVPVAGSVNTAFTDCSSIDYRLG